MSLDVDEKVKRVLFFITAVHSLQSTNKLQHQSGRNKDAISICSLSSSNNPQFLLPIFLEIPTAFSYFPLANLLMAMLPIHIILTYP